MLSRRHLMLGASVALAAPHIIRSPAIAANPIVRRDVMDMAASDRFFSDYGKAVAEMHKLKDGRNWSAQARIHADNCHHGEVEFLHWHRNYIRFFEKICAKFSGNPDFALPYWNWSKNAGRIPAPFFDRPELNVEHWNDPGQYVGKAWGRIDTVGRRGLDKTHGLMDDPTRGGAFTLANINAIKRLPSIDKFHPALEGQPHNTGHVIAGATKSGKGGHIGSGLSPLDPIFWLHHCMVDRVWAEWQKSGHVTPDPKSDYSGQFFEADGAPAKANSTDVMDIANLGYTYDIFQRPVSGFESVQVDAKKIDDLKQLLQPGAAQSIGSAAYAGVSRVNAATSIDVAAPSIASRVTQLQALESATGTTGGQHVLAVLSDIVPPEKDDLVVNVFVNCPYLSPSTPASDPHYAGTFSFFGASKDMQGMSGMHSATYVVDITEAVRQAGLADDKVRVQLMPLTAAAGAESGSTFKVGKVEIVSV
ncbi:MAG TPA: tyrosinase family protein [Bradyrhizobium sp.]|jgi:tyrosinase|uniref:tyrosinase family protein n=1 Tax=Bradyrhizobium sp. TaxID=376 RepID=UPI002D017AB9|nr:tyrosinase family protein [Bradyrhizobium sp.]HTB03325.1 tyrosinase family protein [Bradyrhizobium sp.]